MHRRTLTAAVLAAAMAVTLAACGSTTSGSDVSTGPSESSTAPTATVTATDPWIKAADDDMTAAFVVLTNNGGQDLVLVSAASQLTARVELHEMAMVDGQMVMQAKDGGIALPAGATVALEPGGDHIMLMDLTEPIEPGDLVPITLSFSDGQQLRIDAVAKEFMGGAEPYHSAGPSTAGR